MEQYREVSELMTETSQVISDDVMMYLHISLNIVVRTIISVVGVVTNLINMVIFTKLGLKDSMSVGLFALSLTDFLVTGIQLASCICFMIDLLCPHIGTDARFLGYYTLGWAITAIYDDSCWITAMVSVERWYCVVSPFKVKQVFTRYLCIFVILAIYFLYIGIHAPIYIYERMEVIKALTFAGNSTTNGTPEVEFTLSINQEVQLLEFILDITAGVSMWLISQVVIIVCTVWMAYSLGVSARVRYTIASEGQDISNSKLAVYRKQSPALSNRERRLVRVVLFLAVTLTCCNVPKLITTVIFYTFPDANSGNQENLSTVLWTVAITFGSLGCSVSFVVYLKLNAKYRHEFAYIFRCGMDNSTSTRVASSTKSTSKQA